MERNTPESDRYLDELLQRTQGKTNAQVSMFAIGAAIGLEKEASRKLAEDLIAEGLVEIKTLSGGIGITEMGIDMARPAGGADSGPGMSLGDTVIMEEKGCRAAASILTEIKNRLASGSTPYARLEEMVIDIKTIEVHLLSPRPKTAVIRTVLHSLKDGLQSCGAKDLAEKVERMIRI